MDKVNTVEGEGRRRAVFTIKRSWSGKERGEKVRRIKSTVDEDCEGGERVMRIEVGTFC